MNIWWIALLIVGLALALFPKLIWKLEEFLFIKNATPDKTYMTVRRVSGIICIIIAVIMIIKDRT